MALMCMRRATVGQVRQVQGCEDLLCCVPESALETGWPQASMHSASDATHHSECHCLHFVRHAHDVAGAASSVDPDEIKRFAALSGKWWDTQGAFSALHRMNPVRVDFIVTAVRGNMAPRSTEAATGGGPPLSGLRALDVGCGGGLLCEPLARLGAHVVGVDATRENVEAARRHARESPDIAERLAYVHTTVEEHVAFNNTAYDLVVSLPVARCPRISFRLLFTNAHVTCTRVRRSR